MAKMNWDRVQNWDRVRGDLSNMELADERDDRWFEREQERELARADPPAANRVPPKKPRETRRSMQTNVQGAPTATFSGKQGTRRLAASIGVTCEELVAARHAESRASTGLAGMKPKARLEAAARRLSITPTELKMLRKGLNGQLPRSTIQLASLVRLAGQSGSTAQSRRAPAAIPPQARSKAPPTQRRDATSAPIGLPATTQVYVTTWGNVVHLHHDCHSARGFRHTDGPDPDIYRVPANDPCCRGRRVCGTCTNSDETKARHLSRLLVGLHGQPFDERDWERYGWDRPRPPSDPINRKRR